MADDELKPIAVPEGERQAKPQRVLKGLHSILAEAYDLHRRGELDAAQISTLGAMLDRTEAAAHLRSLDDLAEKVGDLSRRCIISHVHRNFLQAVKPADPVS